jgi:hypothetical protein
MKIKVRCPCCGEDIFVDVDSLINNEKLSEDEMQGILSDNNIEFG